MKMKSIHLLIAVATFCTAAQADDLQDRLASEGAKINKWRRFLPNALVLDGVSYSFDQDYPEKGLSTGLEYLKKTPNDQQSSKENISQIKSQLAYDS